MSYFRSTFILSFPITVLTACVVPSTSVSDDSTTLDSSEDFLKARGQDNRCEPGASALDAVKHSLCAIHQNYRDKKTAVELVTGLLEVQNVSLDALPEADRAAGVEAKVQAMLGFFSKDYVSLLPQFAEGAVPPDQVGGFVGHDTIRQHWSGFFGLRNVKVQFVEGTTNVAANRSTTLSAMGPDVVVSKQIWSGDFVTPEGTSPFSTQVTSVMQVSRGVFVTGYFNWHQDVAPPQPPPPAAR
jgi:hypothetical protein